MLCYSLAVLVQALLRRSSSVDHKAPAPHVLNVEIRRGNVVDKVCTVVVCVVMWWKVCLGVVWYDCMVYFGVWCVVSYDV